MIRLLLVVFVLFLFSCKTPLQEKEEVQSPPSTSELPREPFLKVLGIAQDAGYPQADCQRGCCKKVTPQRVACLGLVDPSTGNYWLLDATPDFTSQLADIKSSAGNKGHFSGIMLTHAHIGHYTGLMYLGREAMGAHELPVFAMPRMTGFLQENGPWNQLVSLKNVKLVGIKSDSSFSVSPTLKITPILVPHRDEFSETVGYRIEGPKKTAIYIPDIDKWERWNQNILDLVEDSDILLLDGTFYANGEIPNRDMSEIPHPFIEESMERFATLSPELRQRIHFIHLNHTNPLLVDESLEQSTLQQAGFQLAWDGQIFAL